MGKRRRQAPGLLCVQARGAPCTLWSSGTSSAFRACSAAAPGTEQVLRSLQPVLRSLKRDPPHNLSPEAQCFLGQWRPSHAVCRVCLKYVLDCPLTKHYRIAFLLGPQGEMVTTHRRRVVMWCSIKKVLRASSCELDSSGLMPGIHLCVVLLKTACGVRDT